MSCGFFGKIPASGDFVARGLPAKVQPVVDRWLTHHLAQYAGMPDLWPDTGLCAMLDGPTKPIALLIVPSQDAAGRQYPLAVYANGAGADRATIDHWAQLVHPLAQTCIRDSQKADDLHSELMKYPAPETGSEPLAPPALWGPNTGTNPQNTLRALFNSA